ncbi:MAG: hypothetical protein KatS3mg104_2590 [Phycisphaerae bacterium]|jgi:Spy/CpxP family protein refolding chaperone|nr:MAG: hypothetical protein KatS3mg104_2590 [Phycisphaerae bacterium]
MNPFIRPFVVLTSGAALICASGTVLAAENPPRSDSSQVGPRVRNQTPDFQPGMRFGRLIHELDLTDQQRDQIRQIASEIRQKLQTLRSELKDASVQERRTRIQQEIAPLREKMMSVLTDEQKAVLKQKIDQLRQNHEGRFGKNRFQDTDQPRKRLEKRHEKRNDV